MGFRSRSVRQSNAQRPRIDLCWDPTELEIGCLHIGALPVAVLASLILEASCASSVEPSSNTVPSPLLALVMALERDATWSKTASGAAALTAAKGPAIVLDHSFSWSGVGGIGPSPGGSMRLSASNEPQKSVPDEACSDDAPSESDFEPADFEPAEPDVAEPDVLDPEPAALGESSAQATTPTRSTPEAMIIALRLTNLLVLSCTGISFDGRSTDDGPTIDMPVRRSSNSASLLS